MRELASYSLAEIEEQTGFTRRIIAFYVQQGLLPKVGRRGPRTRYPETFLHRLQLVAGIRDLQDHGQLPSATLAEIRALLDALAPEALRRLIRDGMSAEAIAGLLRDAGASPAPAAPVDLRPEPATSPAPELPPQRRSYGLADAGIRARHPGGLPPTTPFSGPASLPGAAAPPTAHADADSAPLGELLRRIELEATLSRQQSAPGAAEHWTQIPVTGRIYLAIRGLASASAPLAEAAGRLLRRALREQGGPSGQGSDEGAD